MSSIVPPAEGVDEPLATDLADCLRQFDAVDADAEKVIWGLDEDQFHWSPASSHWSIAQCLVHLAIMGHRYLPILDDVMERARAQGLLSRGPFHYSFVERWVVHATEPPPRIRLRTPLSARPPDDRTREIVHAEFLGMQQALRNRVRGANGLDLARARVISPFAKSLKMGLGSCFSFLAAHERRHLWQAWQVRRHEDFPRP
ncbi:MAG TPA: DinB family protein [Bryobacteraceae bacterium]|nr:DinB family protein [Bryobacteraceae bacterium]